MKRTAILVSGPGDPNADDFLDGAAVDVKNYRRFLMSPFGGYWADTNEVLSLFDPTIKELRNRLKFASENDYCFFVYSGHGYALSPQNTALIFKDGDFELQNILRFLPKKATVILDCCRKWSLDEVVLNHRISAKVAADATDYRNAFCAELTQCHEGTAIIHGCEVGNFSYDDNITGGQFSYNFIKSAQRWATQSSSGIREKLSVVGAYRLAKKKMEKVLAYQVPTLLKARTGPYFPFAIR